jgi:Heavy metal associated domain 2
MNRAGLESHPVGLLHAIPGRIRLRVPTVKGNPPAAEILESSLQGVPGVLGAVVNPVTATVLIEYNTTQVVTSEDRYELLGRCGKVLPSLNVAALVSAVRASSAPTPAADRSATIGLPLIISATLVVAGVARLVFSKPRPLPTWYDLIWFGLATSFASNRRMSSRSTTASDRSLEQPKQSGQSAFYH